MPIQNQEANTRPLINKAEVARQARVSTSTVDSLIRAGVLPKPTIQAGRIVRFDPNAVDRALGGDK